MLSLAQRALGSPSSYQDNITYLTSVVYMNSLSQEEDNSFVKDIESLVATVSSRYQGLCLLELALRQNFDVLDKAKWNDVLFNFLKDPIPSDCKEKVCSIFSLVINTWAKDPINNQGKMAALSVILCPVLIEAADSDILWNNAAFHCLATIVKCFPSTVVKFEERIQQLIFDQTNMVSSKSFEPFAECFCYLPAVQRTAAPEYYKESYKCQCNYTLNTMNLALNKLFCFMPENEKFAIPDNEFYSCTFDPKDDFEDRMISVRQFINFSSCLAKQLSAKSKHPVQVPIQQILSCVKRVFNVEAIARLNVASVDNQILLSSLCQLQVAALALLEPILINFGNHVVPFTGFICDILKCALQASRLPSITSEPISQIRHVVWKLLKLWLGSQGSRGAAFKIIDQAIIIKELLSDISIQEKPPEVPVVQPQGKTKKTAPVIDDCSNNYENENWYVVCKEALKALKRILYGGGTFLDKKMYQEILSKIVHIAFAIHPSEKFPFPYTNESCRKNVYDVLLALTVISRPAQLDTLQQTIVILENAKQDSSNKVTAVCCKAAATCRLALHPKKPPIKDAEVRRNLANTSGVIGRFEEFSSEDNFIENLPPLEEEAPVEPCHIAQSYSNNSEMPSSSNDYAQIDIHYSDEAAESQLNGDDILEIQNTSQSHEDEESEEGEGDDDDDEYEDEERSFDEEMNEEGDLQSENMYIPSTDELQVMTPVHIVPETVQNEIAEPEYEELRPSESKVQTNALSNSNSKNVHINGVHNSVPDEDEIQSMEIMTNENGVYGSEDEEVEDEEGDEDEEVDEEEVAVHYPAEKRVPDFVETPAAKKQKVDVDIELKRDQVEEVDQRSMSPTIEEMKADFVLSDGEEVES